MFDTVISKQFSVAGKSFSHQQTLSLPDLNAQERLIPVAQPGVLTVRTDANTGSLTMDNTSHGISTGNKLDLYWTNADGTTGQMRLITAGTVSAKVVPIDLGIGDDLPIATTVIQAAVVQSFPFVVTGDNVGALLGGCDFARGTITLLDSGGTVEDLYMELILNGCYGWTGDGTNPIAGKSIDTIHYSHNDTVTPRSMRVAAGLTV